MKKALALLLCGVMSMALLTGCGNDSTPASNTDETTEGAEASDEGAGEAQASGERTTLP